MNKLFLIGSIIAAILLSGCSDSNNETHGRTKAFFGDKELNRVVIADVEEMAHSEPEFEAYTEHEITYAVDNVPNKSKAYISNRGSNAVDVISTDTNKITKTIKTTHYPRSADAMRGHLCEVSGMDKAMASIIDTNTDEIVAEVGDTTEKNPEDEPEKGGSHATGHPYWLNDTDFVIVDRYNRKLILYKIDADGKTQKINEAVTSTSVHQLIPRVGYHGPDDIYYAVEEGTNTEYPSIIKLQLTKSGLNIIDRVELQKSGVNAEEMKGHHGDFHPTQKLIYVGSAEGNMFLVNYETMKIDKVIQAGQGAGHTFMASKKGIAIIINHSDTFVTVVDLETNTKITDARVSDADDLVGNATIQAHTEYYMSDDGYFYMVLTEEGLLVELDSVTYKVTRTLEFGGKPAMGTFVKY